MADAKVNQYEAMFLFGGSASGDLDQAQNLCRQVIEKHEGQIQVLKKWDDRRMAYEIAGQKRGVYIIAFFKAPGQAVTAIEREVSLTDQILRVMVLRADHLNEQEMAAVEPQPIPPKEERGHFDRPRYDDRSESSDSPKAAAVAETDKE